MPHGSSTALTQKFLFFSQSSSKPHLPSLMYTWMPLPTSWRIACLWRDPLKLFLRLQWSFCVLSLSIKIAPPIFLGQFFCQVKSFDFLRILISIPPLINKIRSICQSKALFHSFFLIHSYLHWCIQYNTIFIDVSNKFLLDVYIVPNTFPRRCDG